MSMNIETSNASMYRGNFINEASFADGIKDALYNLNGMVTYAHY